MGGGGAPALSVGKGAATSHGNPAPLLVLVSDDCQNAAQSELRDQWERAGFVVVVPRCSIL
jgi:hypothetical protein